MKLYFTYFSIHLRAAMQYKTSFFLTAFGQGFTTFFSFISMYFLFERFSTIKGYTFNEVLLCFGTIYMAFALAECFGRGFDAFSSTISNGEFDRMMVRPQHEVLQVIGSKMELTRIGRLIQATAVFFYAVFTCGVVWDSEKIGTLILMIVGGVCIFFCLFVLYASICFFTLEGLEFMNIFTDGGKELNQYPLDVYKKSVVKFFTFVIPFSLVNYYPFLFIIGKADGIFYMLSPLFSFLFIIPSFLLWRLGIKHYKSTGS